MSYSCRGSFCDVLKHSVPFTAYDALFWLQKFGKALHLLNCVSDTGSLLIAGLKNSVRPLRVTHWPDDHFLPSFPYNYAYHKTVMTRCFSNLPQDFLQRIQIFNSLFSHLPLDLTPFCLSQILAIWPILENKLVINHKV